MFRETIRRIRPKRGCPEWHMEREARIRVFIEKQRGKGTRMTSDTGYVGTPPSRISPSKMPTAYLLVPPRRGLWRPPVSPAIKRRFSTVYNRGTRYTSRPWRLDAENLAGESRRAVFRVDIQGCTRVETNVCRGLIVTNLRDRVYHVIVKLEGRTIMRAAWRNDLGYCANPSRASLATEFRTRLYAFDGWIFFVVCIVFWIKAFR